MTTDNSHPAPSGPPVTAYDISRGRYRIGTKYSYYLNPNGLWYIGYTGHWILTQGNAFDVVPNPALYPDFATAREVDRLPLVLPEGWVDEGWEKSGSARTRTIRSRTGTRVSFNYFPVDCPVAKAVTFRHNLNNLHDESPTELREIATIIEAMQTAWNEGDRPC